MDEKWTERQREGIEARGMQILVSAAAGSGKTSVLTERVKTMLCDKVNKCPVSDVLITTFTRAAAEEMRQRISAALNEELKNNPDDLYLRNQLLMLPTAEICTIDKFCLTLLKDNFHIAGVSSDFSICDKKDSDFRLSECVNETVNELYENSDPDFIELVKMFASEKDDNEINTVLTKLYEFAYSYLDPEKWLDDLSAFFDPSTDKGYEVWSEAYIENLKLRFDYYLGSQKKALDLVRDVPKSEAYIDYGQNRCNQLENIIALLEKGKYDDFVAVLYSLGFETAPKFTGESANIDVCKGVFTYVKEKIIEFQKELLIDRDKNTDDMEKLYHPVRILCDAVKKIIALMDEKNRESNSYSFFDVLHKSFDIITKLDGDGNFVLTRLGESLRKKYKFILIDEYQDTNAIQNALFNAISDNGKNLYCVGDVKQSIYRFRQATPELFISLKDSLSIYDGSPKPSKIILDANFRSRKTVTEAVNFLFSRLMSRSVGEIEYNEEEHLTYGAKYHENEDHEFIELLVFDETKGKSGADSVTPEARRIARYIKEKVESGVTVGKDENIRKIDYGDFAVLMRKVKDDAEVFKKVFHDAGIPVVCESEKPIGKTREIMLLTSLLKAVNNPLLDIPLIAVMSSPIFGFTKDELSQIRSIDKNADFFVSLSKCAAESPKATLFLEKLRIYRNMSAIYPVGDFVRYIVEDTGLTEIFLSFENGSERKQNISYFTDIADSFTENGGTGLAAFVRYIDALEEDEKLTFKNVSEDDGKSVKILTVHQSKGLEYPYVIFARCGSNFNTEDKKKSFITSRKYGIGLSIKDPEKMVKYKTMSFGAARFDIESSGMSEELRLLYVAMTRAREHLVFSCSFSSKKQVERIRRSAYLYSGNSPLHPCAVLDSDSFAEWIMCALIAHPDCRKLREFVGVTITDFAPKTFAVKETFYSCDEADAPAAEREFCEKADIDLIEKIRERTTFVYKYDELTGILAKRTASSFEAGSSVDFTAKEKPTFIGGKLSGADKGTAVHAFLEKCDFKKLQSDFDGEKKRLCESGILTPEQAECVTGEDVSGFINTDIGKRLLSSSNVLKEYAFSVFRKAKKVYPELSKDCGDEDILIQGKLDLAFFEDDGAVLVDYKTDKSDDEEYYKNCYSPQLEIYADALSECENITVKEKYIYSFKLKRFIAV